MKNLIIGCLSFVLIVSVTSLHAAKSIKVPVKRKPTDKSWKVYDTRTIKHLEGFKPDTTKYKLDKYGGRIGRKYPATGFFYVKKIEDRFWLIDPEGYTFIHIGVCSVSPGKSKISRQAARKKYSTDQAWAQATNKLLHGHGFNGTGAWTSTDLLRQADQPPVYTQTWYFMGSFGRAKKLVWQEPGHLGYPNRCIPVFHPEFESFCNQFARQLTAYKEDPYLLGHFSDNELPISQDLLDRSFQLDASNPDLKPGFDAALRWLSQRKGRPADTKDITDADRQAFLQYACAEYFRITTAAIRKYDKNHLCLGPRLHGRSTRLPEVFKAAGKYLDVIAINYYGAWTPDPQRMNMWVRESNCPFIITEWYAKGMDSGLPNNSGAGWTVKTQADRGRFYQNFTLALLESKQCVGWHWFKYRDNNPLDTSTDPSNRDSNKGIVNWNFQSYTPLLNAQKEINLHVYSLMYYFDK
jgi:hypothetical protein